jgi:hypothetical protein
LLNCYCCSPFEAIIQIEGPRHPGPKNQVAIIDRGNRLVSFEPYDPPLLNKLQGFTALIVVDQHCSFRKHLERYSARYPTVADVEYVEQKEKGTRVPVSCSDMEQTVLRITVRLDPSIFLQGALELWRGEHQMSRGYAVAGSHCFVVV